MTSSPITHRTARPVPALRAHYAVPCVMIGVVLVIAVLALGEYGQLHESLFQAVETPIRHHEFLMEAGAVLIVGSVATVLLRVIVSRMQRMSSLLTMCAWCRQVSVNGEWVSIEECLRRRDRTKMALALCPECYRTTHATPPR